MNHPGFGAHLLDWEGGIHAKQVRRADPGESGPAGPRSSRDYASEWEAIRRSSGRLGMNAETLRKWLRQAEVDAGQVEGTTTAAAREIRELKRQERGAGATVEILKAATSFFVRESDPRHR